jgi:hypothetical protein
MVELLDSTQLNMEREAYQNCLRLTRRCMHQVHTANRDGEFAFASHIVESLAGVSTFLDTTNESIELQRWMDLLPILKKAFELNSTVVECHPENTQMTKGMEFIRRKPTIQKNLFLKAEALRVLSTFVRNTEGNRDHLSKEFLDEIDQLIRTVGLPAEYQFFLDENSKRPSTDVMILLNSLGIFFAKWFPRPSDEILQKLKRNEVNA